MVQQRNHLSQDIDTWLTKAWTAIDRLLIIWKSNLTDKMKRSFLQTAVVSIVLYGCTTWTLTKRLEKKLDGNYTRMLWAILNKSWRQHPTRHQLYGHLPPIKKTIQVRRTRHAGHCWRSRDVLISDILILLYGCTTWTLTKRLEKKLDGNYTRMLWAILNKSWRQHPTRHQLYGHLPPIKKTIQVRRTRHAGHCWRSRDVLISDILILLYGCTTWTLTKRLEKKLDGNYTRMLWAILNKSWRQHPTRHQLYGHLPPIKKTIQVRRTRHAGHCWRSRDELISDVLLWTPTYGRAKAGRPARTYILQLCEDAGCSPEHLPEAMKDREKWRERVRDICARGTTWGYIYIYIYIGISDWLCL